METYKIGKKHGHVSPFDNLASEYDARFDKEGCACPINALSSKFLESLALGDGEFLIADTDAGIEHFGRGVERE